ncbi:hypothetical protein MJ563_06810 [Klebsiella pneumoniae]|nr:hypothetical protein MJ563_06810 [Klebsiella pneumoniae]
MLIAMGGGSDVAIETAAITLMRHSLHGVADALAISKATLRNMKQNLLGAFARQLAGYPDCRRDPGRRPAPCSTWWSPARRWRWSSITVVSNANRCCALNQRVNAVR